MIPAYAYRVDCASYDYFCDRDSWSAEEAFIMQRRDGEVMISFFKAAVNHSPTEKQDRPAESPDVGIAGRVAGSAQESQQGHKDQACDLLNESDEIAEQVFTKRPFTAHVLPDILSPYLQQKTADK